MSNQVANFTQQALTPVPQHNTGLIINNRNHNVNTGQFQQAKAHLKIIMMSWISIAVVLMYAMTTCVIQPQSFSFQKWVPTYTSVIATLSALITTYSIFKRKKVFPVITLGLTATTIYFLTMTIIISLKCKYSYICTLSYSGIMLITGLILLKNKGLILIKLALCLQLLLISLKLDEKINADWIQTLIPWLIFTIILFITLVILVTYLVIRSFCMVLQQRFKRQLLILLIVSILGIVLASFVPLLRVYLTTSVMITTVISVSAAVYNISISLYMYFHRQQLSAYFCKSLAPIPQGIFSLSNPQNPSDMYLYQHSTNYFKQQKNTVNCNPEQLDKRQQCVICMTDMAEMVWLPCGHLSTCHTCTDYLLRNNKVQCILCKQNGSQICQIQTKSKESNQKNLNQHRVVKIYRLDY